MGYAARASNGERPQHVTDRRFRSDAAVTINNQAAALNQLLTTTQAQQALLTRLAGDYVQLRKDVDALNERVYAFGSRRFFSRLRWLLTGR